VPRRAHWREAVTVFPGPVLSVVRVKRRGELWGPYPSLDGGRKWVVKTGSSKGAWKKFWRYREVTARVSRHRLVISIVSERCSRLVLGIVSERVKTASVSMAASS
jgi:hypothetical protein